MSKSTKKRSVKHAPEAPVSAVLPEPTSLEVHVQRDGKDGQYTWTIRQGKAEHFTGPDGHANEDAARAEGEKWLAKYAKANAKGRATMLGIKLTVGDASEAKRKAAVAKVQAADAAANAGAVPNAKRERKAKGEKKTSGLDAAAQVLKDAGEPMNCKAIIEKVFAKGLWTSDGKTPHATIYSAILREIQVKGKEARFTKADRGQFAFNPRSTSDKKD